MCVVDLGYHRRGRGPVFTGGRAHDMRSDEPPAVLTREWCRCVQAVPRARARPQPAAARANGAGLPGARRPTDGPAREADRGAPAVS